MNRICGNPSSSSSSSLNSNSHDTEDDHTIAEILAEEEKLRYDGKLGKRLSHLDSIPHTPRTIGSIPDAADARLDHERLADRLATYGLAEMQIEGDGNCQFRAIADQLLQKPDYHKYVRKEVVKQLKHHKKMYESYVPMKYKSYVKSMKRLGGWGDHVTLQAAADRFLVKICLVTSFRDTCYIEILPKDKIPIKGDGPRRSILDFKLFERSEEVGGRSRYEPPDFEDPWNITDSELWLSFWSEIHYNSLHQAGEVPSRKHRKKHWFF